MQTPPHHTRSIIRVDCSDTHSQSSAVCRGTFVLPAHWMLSTLLVQGQGDRVNYLMTKQAKVVAMTCTHAALRRGEFLRLGFQYDNLLMEESAQILEIETFIPMLLQVPDLMPAAPEMRSVACFEARLAFCKGPEQACLACPDRTGLQGSPFCGQVGLATSERPMQEQ